MNRRQLLAGVAALAAWPSRALGAVRTDPDFSLLREADPRVIGVRPHRLGGVRLELEEAPLAPGKWLVHDYGHGGAGITLSWGCAAVVVDLVAAAMARLGEAPPSLAVVGSGVAGLTAATELRRRWPQVPLAVYAKDLDPKTTTSWVAAGQFEPSGVWREYQDRKDLLASYLRKSRDRLVGFGADQAAYGIAPRDNFTLDHEIQSLDQYTPSDVVAPYTKVSLPFASLTAPGRQYRTWLVNPTLLLPRLIADLKDKGARFEQRTFRGRADLAALPANLVVNCTGLGAREVVGDTALVPQRGHLVMLRKSSPGQDWFFSGGCDNYAISYVFCRQEDIVVGGTVLAGKDGTAIAPEDGPVFDKILANGRQLFGGHPEACAI